MPRIFISYRREDSQAEAGRLYDALKARLGRDQVFRDEYTLRPGEEFAVAIERVLTLTDVVLVLIGRRWLSATDGAGRRRLDNPLDLHRQEVVTALELGKVVVPVLVQNASMPEPAELPEALSGLAGRNALELDDSRWEYDVGRLIDGLEQPRGRMRRGATVRALALGTAAAVVLTGAVLLGPSLLAPAAVPPTPSPTLPEPTSMPTELPTAAPTPVTVPTTQSAATADPTCSVAVQKAVFDADMPVVLQAQDWTGAGAAARWVLESFGCHLSEEALFDLFVPGAMSPDLGLLDGSGRGIAGVYRNLGLSAGNAATVTFDEVGSRAGRQPLMIGGHRWHVSEGGSIVGHWVGVRRLVDGQLALANPAGVGPNFGQQTLDREAFAERGPFSAVWVDLPRPPTPTLTRRL